MEGKVSEAIEKFAEKFNVMLAFVLMFQTGERTQHYGSTDSLSELKTSDLQGQKKEFHDQRPGLIFK